MANTTKTTTTLVGMNKRDLAKNTVREILDSGLNATNRKWLTEWLANGCNTLPGEGKKKPAADRTEFNALSAKAVSVLTEEAVGMEVIAGKLGLDVVTNRLKIGQWLKPAVADGRVAKGESKDESKNKRVTYALKAVA